MKNYRVTVNGNVYDVTVEETAGGANYAPAQTGQVQAAAPVAAQVVQPSVQEVPALNTAPVAQTASVQNASGTAGNIKVSSPMPGKILKVLVSAGQNVKKGETILILEAMKMENEIVAPQDGIIAGVNVAVGSSVESGELLATLN